MHEKFATVGQKKKIKNIFRENLKGFVFTSCSDLIAFLIRQFLIMIYLFPFTLLESPPSTCASVT